MAATQAEDVHTSFLFVGDLNGYHQEWLRSMTMNRQGVAAFCFTTVSGWNQLVVSPTDPCMRWNTWPPDDWCSRSSTGCCYSTHRQLRSLISVGGHFHGSADPNLCVSRKVFLKHHVINFSINGLSMENCLRSHQIPTPYKIKVNNCKLIDLVMRIELTRAILMLQFSNFVRNSIILFLIFLYLETCFVVIYQKYMFKFVPV